MKKILTILTCLLLAAAAGAQTNKTIKELERQRENLHRQIEENQSLLNSTQKDVSSQVSQLSVLNGQIEERKKYISRISNDLNVVAGEITRVEKQLTKLQQELKVTKDKYAQSVRQSRKNSRIQDKLLFIFSAETLSQTYRRMRYVREYAAYQRMQGEKIMAKQKETENKKAELMHVKAEKEKLLAEREQEMQNLEKQEKEKQTLVNSLKRKQRELQKVIRDKKKQAASLNAKIDRLIQIEIEKARKRAEEEARREREKQKQTASPKSEKEKMPEYNLAKADRALSGSFEKNKGILPVPVTGSYLIVSHYGEYNVGGLKGVKLDNKGIDIQARPGAQARSVFNGEVSAVFEHMGLKGIIIRHGSYISVYYKLSAVSVKSGDKVKTGQAIGTIYSDRQNGGETVLHFQLRKETVKLNPELWIDR